MDTFLLLQFQASRCHVHFKVPMNSHITMESWVQISVHLQSRRFRHAQIHQNSNLCINPAKEWLPRSKEVSNLIFTIRNITIINVSHEIGAVNQFKS